MLNSMITNQLSEHKNLSHKVNKLSLINRSKQILLLLSNSINLKVMQSKTQTSPSGRYTHEYMRAMTIVLSIVCNNRHANSRKYTKRTANGDVW